MRWRANSILLSILSAGVVAEGAYESDCCNGRDEDGDERIDAEDSDCGDSPCLCTRPELELFFGHPGEWGRGETPQNGDFLYADASSNTLSIRLRSMRESESFRFRIVRSSRGTDHVYTLQGPEGSRLPEFTILLDFVPGVLVYAWVPNQFVTARRILSVEPGPVFDGFPAGGLVEVNFEDPSGDVIDVIFHGSSMRDEGLLEAPRNCGGFDLIHLELEPTASAFRRGDFNADGQSNIADAIAILAYLFVHGDRPPCDTAADVDANGILAVTDALRILIALFGGGPPIPAPFPECGPRLDEDSLGCGSFDC
jgi:hypothetical protein